MNTYLKKLLLAAIAIAATLTIQVFATSVSAAGPSLGFPPGKPYYGSSNQRASQPRDAPTADVQKLGTGNRSDRTNAGRGGSGTVGRAELLVRTVAADHVGWLQLRRPRRHGTSAGHGTPIDGHRSQFLLRAFNE